MGRSTQSVRLLVPKPIPFMAFGTKNLKYWLFRPSGQDCRGCLFQTLECLSQGCAVEGMGLEASYRMHVDVPGVYR